MKGHKVAAIITISDCHEDWQTGLSSVVNLSEYFTELHVVYPKGYKKMDESRFVGLIYRAHDEELNIALLNNVLLAVHVRPDHNVEETALVELLESAQENRRHCDHYAVRGKVDCEHVQHTYLLGFLWLLTYMDWFRALLNLGGYHTADDLRATKVIPAYPTGAVMPQYSHAWLFAIWSRIARVRTVAQGLILAPPKGGSENNFVFRNIYTHSHIGAWNAMWWLCFAVYYICFALPWWNAYFASVSYTQLLTRPSVYTVWSWVLWRNVWSPVWLALWGAQIVFCMWVVARRYKHVNLSWVFLMPVYVTLSPLVFAVARSGLWIAKMKKKEE